MGGCLRHVHQGSQFVQNGEEMYDNNVAFIVNQHVLGDRAGESYCRAAECFLKLQSKHEAASNYINAANCYKKSNVTGT